MSSERPDPPLGRDLPCPACSHSHLYLACDVCACVEVWLPGIY